MHGWIKAHRSLLASNIFTNEKLFKVFMWCLLKASHAAHEQIVGRQVVVLEPGQFVFGRRAAAMELSMKESSVYDFMKLLERDNTITIKSGNKFSVVTVVNWGFYQGEDDTGQQQTDSKPTAEQQQIDTNKKEKNEKNEKDSSLSDKSAKKRVYESDSPFMKMAVYLRDKIIAWKPDYVMRGSMQNWANEFRLIHELDGRAKEPIKAVIDFATTDSFWQSVVMSPAKLRKQFDALEARARAQMPAKQPRHEPADHPAGVKEVLERLVNHAEA